MDKYFYFILGLIVFMIIYYYYICRSCNMVLLKGINIYWKEKGKKYREVNGYDYFYIGFWISWFDLIVMYNV